MTLNYITSDSWWDTDVSLLPTLCKEFDINMFVGDLLGDDKYPHKENFAFKHLVRYKPRFHNWDPRKIFYSLPFCWKVIKATLRKDTLNLFVLGVDPYLLVLLYFFLDPKRTVIASHNYREHTDGRKTAFARVFQRYFYHFHRFLFFSSLQKEDFLRDHPDKQAFHINMSLKDFGQPTTKRTDPLPTFLFFGSIRDYKRPDLFIKAANSLPPDKARFIMAGHALKWKKYAPLIKKGANLQLDIRFIENEEIPNYFAQADFLVLPYEDATQSGPSLIAVNYGIPIIASRLEAFERLIQEGETGYLFPPGDGVALLDVLRHIIEAGPDNIARMKANMAAYKDQYIKTTDVAPTFKELFNL